jgi:hypothetical protein
MNQVFNSTGRSRTRGITFISVVNGIGFVVTLGFWLTILATRIVPPPGTFGVLSERANAATTYGFAIGDLVWAAPLLFCSCAGLWRMRFWGWTAAQMTNALWIYSMTVVLFRDLHTSVTPGSILFTPFAVISIWATYHLWVRRRLFFDGE